MSFSINIVGSRAAVKAAVNAEQYVPQGLKDVVAAIADASSPSSGALQVIASGHTDATSGGNIYKFEVNPVVLAVEAPAPEAAAAAPTPSPA